MKLVFGNIDYLMHTSDEGNQFQIGLKHAGWTIVGKGYEDNCADVNLLLSRYKPEAVVVHDKRDWSPESKGSFRKDVGFTNLAAIRTPQYANMFRACVVKDAGSVKDYHRQFFEEIHANAVVVYYHEQCVRALNPWLRNVPLIRTYHSLDRETCETISMQPSRMRAVVTGATSPVYPLRDMLMRFLLSPAGARHDIKIFGHPGYHNRGTHTPTYLRELAKYRVHFASASRYGFALRKIIESVAMGCTPVTDLPAFDALPEIDGALLRISPRSSINQILAAIDQADKAWNFDERMSWAEKARHWYDWREIGVRLSTLIDHVRTTPQAGLTYPNRNWSAAQ